MKGMAAVAALAWLCVAPAMAGVDEFRLGAAGNIRSDHGEIVEGKHEGANAEIELVFASPRLLAWAGAPRPYVMGSLATSEDGVSFAGAGLVWRWEFAGGWALEPGLGYIVHDGETDNPFADGAPEAVAFERDNQLLGSRDLFRTSVGLEREFGDRFAVQLYWAHMSHGEILGDGDNQGLDYVGVRGIFRFDPAAG